MRKISEIENEDALDLMARLIEPVGRMMTTPQVEAAFRNGNRLEIIKMSVKYHKPEIIEILAALKGVPVEEYHANIPMMLMDLNTLLQDKELMMVFQLQKQPKPEDVSGSVTENIEETEEA